MVVKRERGDDHEEKASGPYTVGDALRDYLEARERKGSRGVYSDRRYAETRIIPSLGNAPLARLTAPRLRRWHEGLATEGKLLRTRPGAASRASKAVDIDDPDAVRARRATANRIMTILKAALNRAFEDGKVASDTAWRRTKPFREVDTAVVRYLSTPEAVRLVNASPADFREIVRGALLTGCRIRRACRDAGRRFQRRGRDDRCPPIKVGKGSACRVDDGRLSSLCRSLGRPDRQGPPIHAGRREGLGVFASATADRGGVEGGGDRSPRDLSYFAPHVRQRGRHEGHFTRSDRRATWTRRHTRD